MAAPFQPFNYKQEKNIMTSNVPEIINEYVNASNSHNSKSILGCFSNNAVVHDEGEVLKGKNAIEDWIAKTIEKYEFHLEPIDFTSRDSEVVVVTKVSGTFQGSPVHLDFHFTIENNKISSLIVR
jgi:ketosteroid isomerase-like protein